MVQTANTIWRDFEADGIPSSGDHDPKKSEIRTWGTWVEGIISAFTSGGGLVFTSKAALDAKLSPDADTLAWVINDPVVENNGIYQKQGASGTGSWTRVSDLPFSFIIASDAGAGTPNAIQATTSIPVSGSALIWMNIFEANTASPVTVSFNGESALTIKTNSGNDVVAGGLLAGMIVLGIVSGTTFRLVSDQASSAVLAAAEAAKTAAEAARDAALAAANAGYLFDTEAAFLAAGIPVVLQFVETSGYSSVGDGGGHRKVRIAAPGVPEAWQKQSADGAWWEVRANRITPGMLGGDFAAAAAYSLAFGAELVIDDPGTLALAETQSISGVVRGRDPASVTLQRATGTNPAIRVDLDGTTIERLTIDNMASVGSRAGHGIRATADDFTARDLFVKDFGSMDGVGGGTGVLVFDSGGGRPQRPHLFNLRFLGNTASQITIGWILESTDYGMVGHIHSENIIGTAGIGFAHELKNTTKWTNLHQLTAVYAESAYAIGGESLGTGLGASYNLLYGLLGDKVDKGIDDAWGRGNAVVGTIVHADGRPGSATESYAVRLQGAIKGHYADINAFGTGANARGVLLEGATADNFIQLSGHVEGTYLARLLDTVRSNAVEITHPGARTSILGTVLDTSGAPSHGAGANVFYCHATGEYIGSLSGRFRHFLGDPGASFNAGDRFQFARDSNVVLAMGTPSTAGTIVGLRHAMPGNGGVWGFLHTLGATLADNTVTMSGWGIGDRYVWESASFRPGADNAISLGKSGFRFTSVWAVTGSIQTSDKREKSAPIAIDDALLDAWADVQIVAFKWLQSIAEKGEGLARWHYGVIAQQVRDTLVSHGIISLVDGHYINVPAFLCHDVWEDHIEDIIEEVERQVEVTKTISVKTDKVENGDPVYEEMEVSVVDTITETIVTGKRLVRAAGELWGIRADQCLFVESAFARRRAQQAEDRLTDIERRLSKLETT
ncbi:tail fiber domain-containing protein [Sinorhizobium meliloti]|uniref:tail fiber domain-containing protein n=1 Tax=Rhizobium meliloti TaxID=382 RepID=UPI003D654921